ncbi:O-antigen ligase [Acuticoccus sp. I52.16.1]|uniref:O-antigen ligase family protein n=1 Tax=Acuticoccus sp. I52.16.1 TaxID=2928472 RepID=UPI001FD250F7|nr:O-antigen ligase family protein [Acuticoccus sp. I52.16.1]UOM35547.1 O-antigen ligase family protein [Acuticoccus sp. I52.16.1]
MRTSGETGTSGAGFIGWIALMVALASAIPLGANRPVSWIGLALAIFALFAIGLLLELRNPSVRAARLWPSALLAGLAIGWGFVQTSPSLSALAQAIVDHVASAMGREPPVLMHPVWDTVEVAPTISADPIDGRHVVLRLACYVALFWLAVQAGRDNERGRTMLGVAALAVTLVATFGLFAAATGNNPILGEDAGALSATFVNRNSFGTYAAFGVVINLALLLTRLRVTGGAKRGSHVLRDFLERLLSRGWIHVVGFAVCAVALLGSQSRGGALAAIAGAAFVLALSARAGGRRSGLVAALVVALAIFVASVGASGVFGRFLATDTSEEARGAVYLATVDAIADRPLLGHGAGSFTDIFRAYVPEGAGMGEWDKAHNTYLELVFELGVPAAMAFLLAIFIVVARVVRGAVSPSNDTSIGLAASGCALAAGVHSLFDFSLQIPAVAALFAFVLGLGYAYATREVRMRSSRRPGRPVEA